MTKYKNMFEEKPFGPPLKNHFRFFLHPGILQTYKVWQLIQI